MGTKCGKSDDCQYNGIQNTEVYINVEELMDRQTDKWKTEPLYHTCLLKQVQQQDLSLDKIARLNSCVNQIKKIRLIVYDLKIQITGMRVGWRWGEETLYWI